MRDAMLGTFAIPHAPNEIAPPASLAARRNSSRMPMCSVRLIRVSRVWEHFHLIDEFRELAQ